MKLVLGTVQFGMTYGITNVSGPPTLNQVKSILHQAQISGIDFLDTARSYGESEVVLGESAAGNEWKIVSKLPAYIKPSEISSTLNLSLQALKRDSLYGLLLHRSEDFIETGGAKLFAELNNLKLSGIVKKIGFSVYNPEILKRIIGDYTIDLVQLPLNVFGQSFLEDELLERLKSKNIEVHVRSPFLQGIALAEISRVPALFSSEIEKLKDFENISQQLKVSKAALALNFLKKNPFVDKIVFGVDSLEQLRFNLDAYHTEIKFDDYTRFKFSNNKLANPSLWNVL